ncbi:MAG TPA: hypothetical protein PKH95_03720 [Candidatus Magasanikbacteria bacterium]|nr:hypothetical protein [Candidatus Magasanikbacteria bacterium]
MGFDFEKLFPKNTETIPTQDAREIFDMFDEANISLTGEAKDIVVDATEQGFISRENLEKLLSIVNESEITEND